MTQKSDITVKPGYYDYYLGIIPEEDVMDALYASLKAIKELDLVLLKKIGLQVYAPGKWTVHDLLQHLIDTERIFQYRALSFARGDSANLPGMDENAYGANTGANERPLEEIVSDYITVRNSSISLFKSFTSEMMGRSGMANNAENSVLALGYFMTGHQLHHFKVMRERYFPLAV
jgi:hypothetical protein